MKQKITMYSAQKVSIEERFEQFLSAAAASGFSEKTLKMYREHLHCISKHLDISQPLSILTKAQLESAVASMRKSGLSANSISSYMRAFKSFLSWCDRENYAHVVAPVYKQKDTVKETYTDDELKKRREKMEAKGTNAWKPLNRKRQVSKALQMYAAMATSADRGAVRDISR